MNLSSLRGWMKGEDCVVVGCGPSAHRPPWEHDKWIIACNRSVNSWPCDFACCVEPTSDKEMWGIIREASPFVTFSHIPRDHSRLDGMRVVQFGPKKDIRSWFDPDITEPHQLRLGQSPFYAAACAIWMGFETIGLIGVDLTEDRYPDVGPANAMYGRLAELGETHGSRLVNLSPESRLTSVPQAPWGKVRAK